MAYGSRQVRSGLFWDLRYSLLGFEEKQYISMKQMKGGHTAGKLKGEETRQERDEATASKSVQRSNVI